MYFKVFPLTVDTRSGAPGLPVAGHAQEELSNALVHAPVPVPKMEEETAVNWDELKKQGHVTHKDVQVLIFKWLCSTCSCVWSHRGIVLVDFH